MVTAAAHFAREKIEDNRLADSQRHVVLAAAVRETAVAPLGKNHAVVFQAAVHQFAAHQAFDIANGDPPSIIIQQIVASGLQAGDIIPSPLHNFVGALGDRADAADFMLVFGQPGLIKEGRFSDKFILAQFGSQQAVEGDGLVDLPSAVQADSAGGQAQFDQDFRPEMDSGFEDIAFGRFEDISIAEFGGGLHGQAAFLGFFKLHAIADQQRRPAAQLKNRPVCDVSAVG